MKSYRFGHQKLSIKTEHLNKMIDSVLSFSEITRATVGEAAKVSPVTAGKLLDALDRCGFTHFVYKYPEGGGRASKQHVINEVLSILVIDLSSPEYSMTLVRGGNKVRFCQSYEYSPEISLKENLKSFLSRIGLKALQQKFGVSAICVILPDPSEASCRLFNAPYFPEDYNRTDLDAMIASFFGALPLLYATASEALAYGMKYKRIPELSNRDTVYIYAGRSLRVCYLPKDGKPIMCRAGNLLINGGITVLEAIEQADTTFEMGKIISRVVNFADCAFEADQYLIEYDSVKFGGDMLHEIRKVFVALLRPMPNIISHNHTSSLATLGISAKCATEVIKLHLTGSNKQKTSEDS